MHVSRGREKSSSARNAKQSHICNRVGSRRSAKKVTAQSRVSQSKKIVSPCVRTWELPVQKPGLQSHPTCDSVRVPHVRTSVARISYFAELAATAYAAFSQRKPHAVALRHQPRQEIRDTWAENVEVSSIAFTCPLTSDACLTRSSRQNIRALRIGEGYAA